MGYEHDNSNFTGVYPTRAIKCTPKEWATSRKLDQANVLDERISNSCHFDTLSGLALVQCRCIATFVDTQRDVSMKIILLGLLLLSCPRLTHKYTPAAFPGKVASICLDWRYFWTEKWANWSSIIISPLSWKMRNECLWKTVEHPQILRIRQLPLYITVMRIISEDGCDKCVGFCDSGPCKHQRVRGSSLSWRS